MVLPRSSTDGPPEPRCSARGCRAAAAWALRWNNPAVHTPERRKVWLACDEHREHLTSYLSVRGFLKECLPFDPAHPPLDEGHPPVDGSPAAGTGSR